MDWHLAVVNLLVIYAVLVTSARVTIVLMANVPYPLGIPVEGSVIVAKVPSVNRGFV